MSHHDHHHHEHHYNQAEKNILLALMLNLVFVFVELIGGQIAGSVAITADAVHDLGDSLTIFFAWILQKISRRDATTKFSYGYNRLSLLSSLVVSGVLILSSFFILYQSFQSFRNPGQPHSKIMFALSLVGIFFNGWAFLKLRKGNSHNEKAISLHMLEDLLGWVAVALGAIVLYFKNWPWIDPLLAFFIGLFTLYNAVKNILSVSHLFLQGLPPTFAQEDYVREVQALAGVTSIHDLHVWSLDGHRHVISFHLAVESNLAADAVENLKKQCRTILKNYGHFHCTIETEPKDHRCDDRCDVAKS